MGIQLCMSESMALIQIVISIDTRFEQQICACLNPIISQSPDKCPEIPPSHST